ncbi:MAG: fused MFS/spermidine synthase [bacterium]|nr:fused MFS/spermidine synthase [bacterium]
MRPALYLLFLLSGATALVYQVVWVRQQGLVFGGTHLAVSTVLAVFMGGLALGGWLLGRRADRWQRPLRAYGLLELGIALSALAAYGMLQVYPAIYVTLAGPFRDNPTALTALRFLLAAVAMIVPTTLMGATLPVLSRYAREAGGGLAGHLSLLYGLNTLGAVVGAVVTGFLLLPRLGTSRTLFVAVLLNLTVAVAALLLGRRGSAAMPTGDAEDHAQGDANVATPGAKLVLAGIGISGFCALGYEVLWTRALGTTLGTSTYAFTVMLAAFLSGIGLGSESFGLFMRRRSAGRDTRSLVRLFAAVQALIGCTALGVTWLLGDLSGHSAWLTSALVGAGWGEFAARQATGFAAAFSYMVLPAFLMGVAFPLAGTVHASTRRRSSGAVGEVLAWNTVGAILGALAAGFLLIRMWGIERSLVALSALNLSLAAAIIGAASKRRIAPRRPGRRHRDPRRAGGPSRRRTPVEPGSHGHLSQQPACGLRLARGGTGRPRQHRHPLLPRGRQLHDQRHPRQGRRPGGTGQRQGRGLEHGRGRAVPVPARAPADAAASRPEAGLRAGPRHGHDAGRRFTPS